MSNEQKEILINPSVLGYELNSKQNIIGNYLVPSLISCSFYILHFASDIGVAYRHFREDNPIWAALTIFFMYLPILGCYIVIISAWELWPQLDGCGWKNIRWAILNTLQHTFFPVWSMWRCAERIFWSIEGVRCLNEEEREEILKKLNAPRTIELYYFLQGYLQAAPQILLQLHILMRNVLEMSQLTVEAQVVSIVVSIAQMAKVTTQYQRFKTQKDAGKQYPWYKPHKYLYDSTVDNPATRRSAVIYRCRPSIIIDKNPNKPLFNELVISTSEQNLNLNQNSTGNLSSRRSSEFYEEPNHSLLIERKNTIGRETSVVDGPARLILRESTVNLFHPKRLLEKKGLPEDDPIGKFISGLWWFCFLVARMLAISTFGYFYSTEVIWLLSCHFVLILALLLYDVKSDLVKRAKAMFFLFIGFVYLFCLIEFKIKFKKVRFIYNLFFGLMFTENFIMVFIWWFRDVEEIFNDWWFKYIFYMIIICSVLSLLSMLMYMRVLKPKKVILDVIPQT